jgi:hypothetical protein
MRTGNALLQNVLHRAMPHLVQRAGGLNRGMLLYCFGGEPDLTEVQSVYESSPAECKLAVLIPPIGGTLGQPRGKRRVVTMSGRTKTEAKAKLREVMRDHEDGFQPNAVTARSRRWRTGWRTGWVYRSRAPW